MGKLNGWDIAGIGVAIGTLGFNLAKKFLNDDPKLKAERDEETRKAVEKIMNERALKSGSDD